ncbi:FAD:protein FMN transferase [Albidovulum sediminicola]|uniref:FAD:protein FMN transferase n=1 Tax=Albidovulum sediminicola TaxID=2984331 RepID=A0ABT2Z456_9RHOB|nr:FAD:protein FMN transferase [Defluviimonas sp. WL0075]MCV2865896.1 FAD:protein FMN transferase [Defluviimonas sp. WL0075]
MLNRRRFLTISAASLAMASPVRSGAAGVYTWSGIALGARATIRIAHPDAAAICARAAAEIDRLEDVFSLYRVDSALMRLNAAGQIDAPPPELLECLTIAGAVHRATGGLFDPTVQPLWALWAERSVAGGRPAAEDLAAVRAIGGWSDLRLDAAQVAVLPGMALTLNGIAQGYIADRVATLLEAEGLSDVLIDTGEFRAIGGHPEGGDWPVRLAEGGAVNLRSRALATSAPLGTVFDAEGQAGHILDPRAGLPAAAKWRAVSISAPSAALADALSTAACMASDVDEIAGWLSRFEDARCEAAVPV